MITSSNADFDEDGFGAVIRDVERIYLMLSEYGIEAGDSPTPSIARWDGGGFLPAATITAPIKSNSSAFASESQLEKTGVVPGTYSYPTVTVDDYGRITQIYSQTIAIGFLGTLNVPVFNNGGNARGTGAVDWQQSRSADTQVASGNASTIVGGYGNTASGNYSLAAGNGCTASGLYSCAIGHNANASANYSVVIQSSYDTNSRILLSTTGLFNVDSLRCHITSVGGADDGLLIYSEDYSTHIEITSDYGRINFVASSIIYLGTPRLDINGGTGYNGSVAVRNSAGTGTTTLTFTHGILTNVA